jgi:hypothetical protein
MNEFIKNCYNWCYYLTIQIPFTTIRTLNKAFYWLFPTENQINGNIRRNAINYLEAQQERLNNLIVQEALNNTNILDRAILIRQSVADGIYNLTDLESEMLLVRRLVRNPILLDEIVDLRTLQRMRVITPDQLTPYLVVSPTLEKEQLNLPSTQPEITEQEIVESSFDLDELQEAFSENTANSSINSALQIVEKLL